MAPHTTLDLVFRRDEKIVGEAIVGVVIDNLTDEQIRDSMMEGLYAAASALNLRPTIELEDDE